MGIRPPAGNMRPPAGGIIRLPGIIDIAGSVGGRQAVLSPGRLERPERPERPGSGGRDSGPEGEVGRDCGPVRLSRLPAEWRPLLVAAMGRSSLSN